MHTRGVLSSLRWLDRVLGVGLTVMVAAALLVAIAQPTTPGTARPSAKPATRPISTSVTGRVCSGSAISGRLSADPFGWSQVDHYRLHVPVGATVQIDMVVDVLTSSFSAQWQSLIHIDPVGFNRIFNAGGTGPRYGETFTYTWVNPGPATEQDVAIQAQTDTLATYVFKFSVSGGDGSTAKPCARASAGESLGTNCALRHVDAVQGKAGDPVNTATGNFHESFDDFSVPGRGPGLNLDHSYNSLRAATDGPLGFGWTHSYATALSVDGQGTVTIRQEGGAEINFYLDGLGGYEAPPRAVATLVHNGDGSYTFSRCGDTTMAFSANGQLLSITDRYGDSTSLQYASGQLSGVTDSAGRMLHLTWTGSHITSVNDDSAPPRNVMYAYDGAGNLSDFTDAAGSIWHYDYDASHQLRFMRRPRQGLLPTPKKVENQYDASGRVIKQIDELGAATLFDYTSIANSTKVTDPRGRVTVEAYQNLVRTSLTRAYGTPLAAPWTFETDATLGVTKVTDPSGSSTSATYDAHGNPLAVRDQLNHLTMATYDTTFDQPLTVTDANGTTTTYNYNANGSLGWVSPFDLNHKTLYAYDAAHPSDLLTVTDPDGKMQVYTYDAYGNRATAANGVTNADTTKYGYNPVTGWLVRVVSPRGVAAGITPTCAPPALGCTKIDRDVLGNVTVVTDPLGNTTTRHYDSDHHLDYSLDGELNRTEYSHDDADQLISVKRPDLSIVKTDYWPDRTVKDTVDGANNPTAYEYDAQTRPTTVTDPAGRVTTFGYDPSGNQVSKADTGGTCPAWPISYPPVLTAFPLCTVYRYDATGRRTGIFYGDGTTPNVTNIVYDNVGQRTDMTDGTGTSHYVFDAFLQLKQSTDGAGQTVGYDYNGNGQLKTVTYPGGTNSVNYAYDAAGRLHTVTDWATRTTTYTPDADSNLDRVDFPGGAYTDPTFDNAGRESVRATKALLSGVLMNISSFTYDRFKNDELKGVSGYGANQSAETYTYTPLNQLKSASTSTANYSYDAADNLTGLANGLKQAFDPANQLCWQAPTAGVCNSAPSGARTYSYDSRGNRVTEGGTGAPAMNMSYDQENRLTRVSHTIVKGQLAPGLYHSVAQRPDGSVWAWGQGSSGQLGNNSTAQSLVPVPVSGLANNLAVSAGGYHSLALRADGTVVAWGLNNAYQLGDNTTTNRSAPVAVLTPWGPLGGVSGISAGGSHALALRTDGSVWSWGINGVGQLGGSGDGHVARPVPNLSSGVVAVSAGWNSSAALKSDGTVWTWGDNTYGELGRAAAQGSAAALTPTAIPSFAGVAAISAGAIHDMARKTDGTVWTWGDNTYGELGRTGTTGTPGAVSGLSGVTTMGAGAGHSVARKSDGTLAVWGLNAYGELGDGTTTNRSSPVTLTSPTSVTMIGVGSSDYHTLAATTDGSVFGWGYNSNGQVGNNSTTTPITSPTSVQGLVGSRGPGVATYAYNGDGLRTSKTQDGVTTRFVWNLAGTLPMLLKDDATSYVYGAGGTPIEQITASGTAYYFQTDQLGSVRTVTAGTGGLAATYSYDAYGNRTSTTGSIANPFGFAGEYTDAETGWQYLRARYYDPGTGQFVSRDPAVVLTRSAYGYVDGDPMNGTDPSGLGSCALRFYCNQGAANFAGGVLNVLTFGHERRITGALGLSDHVDRCSGWYTAGEVTATIAMIVAPVVAEMSAARGATLAGEAAEAEASATTPTGRRGSPMDVPRGTNAPGEINGRTYGGHAFDEMQSEGFTPSVVDDAISHGEQTLGRSGRIAHYSVENNVTVITENGKVVTVTSGRVKIR